jgi:hypothetical protein
MIGVIRSHCVSGNMVITKTDSGSSVDSRETLVPIISAAAGAALAVVPAGIVPGHGRHRGRACRCRRRHAASERNRNFALQPATIDPREVRINALETELACERTMHEAFKRDAMQREEELKRFLADLEMTHSVLEARHSQSVELAEELADAEAAQRLSRHHDHADRPAQRLAFQEELKRRVELRAAADRPSPCCSSTSTASRRSTTRWATRPAMSCCSRWPARSARRCGRTISRRACGGDEFAVIVEIPPEEAREVAFSVAERVRQELQLTVRRATPRFRSAPPSASRFIRRTPAASPACCMPPTR